MIITQQVLAPDKKTETQHPFKNRTWKLSHAVHVKTHKYDDTLYAFEITQGHTCLGTLIPDNIGDMERMAYILDNDLSLNGFETNDEFGTIIHVKKDV